MRSTTGERRYRFLSRRLKASAPIEDKSDGDVFAELFRRQQAGRAGGMRGDGANDGPDMRVRTRGPDAAYRLTVDFLEAAKGAKKRIDLPGGRTLDVTIPAGAESGTVLRLAGQGGEGLGDGPRGDALLDQLHDTRRLMRSVLGAIEKLPPDARLQIAAHLGEALR